MNYIYIDSSKNPDIESVVLLFENKILILQENILVIYKKENSYYMYHLYKYIQDNEIIIDRWDYQDFPIEPIENMIMKGSNTLTINIENFKNKETNNESLAIFKIFFTDKGIERLSK